MRRWLWPYAILAVALSVFGLTAFVFLVIGQGPSRVGAQFAVANAVVTEPMMQFLVTMLEMVAPVDLPAWFKQVYAALVMVALGGFVLSIAVGLVLLPVFYAIYRGRSSD